MEFPLFITKYFSFFAFKILSLSLILSIFIIICLSLSLWVQVIWNSLGSLDLDVYFLPKIMVGVLDHFFIQKSFMAFSLLCYFEPLKLESEKVGLKLNIQKTKIMASGPITSWEIDGETVETVSDFSFLGSQVTADGDCSHEIKRRLLLGRKVMTNLDSIFKSRDISLPTNVRLVKAMVLSRCTSTLAGGLQSGSYQHLH